MNKKEKRLLREVYIDDDNGILRRRTVVQNGFVVGNIDKEKLILEMIGNPGFDEVMDDMGSAILHIMQMANDVTEGKSKDLIYDKVNQTISLILDKYDPERVNTKFGTVSDKEIMKLEEEKIQEQYDNLQPEKS